MIISELCQNHNGDKKLLKDMVLASIDAGCKAIKIQTFFAKDLTSEWSTNNPMDYTRLKTNELDWEEHQKFFDLCTQNKVIPMTSVYSTEYLPSLHNIGFKYIKIGSAQATDKELILTYLSTGFHVLVSTGGHVFSDIPRLGPLAGILHCVSVYPHPWYQANMNRIYDLKKLWPNQPIGYSDHTDPTDPLNWSYASKVAMAMGSTWIERHFTLLPRDQTKDGSVSLDLDQMKILCQMDALSLDEKMALLPDNAFHIKQDPKEIETIGKHSKRWKNRWEKR